MDENKKGLTSGNISEIMQSAYIDYSMSVIVSRALPDVRDGSSSTKESSLCHA